MAVQRTVLGVQRTVFGVRLGPVRTPCTLFENAYLFRGPSVRPGSVRERPGVSGSIQPSAPAQVWSSHPGLHTHQQPITLPSNSIYRSIDGVPVVVTEPWDGTGVYIWSLYT